MKVSDLKGIRLLFVMTIAIAAWSCSTFPEDEIFIDKTLGDRSEATTYPDRKGESKNTRNKVFIVYSMGYNNLSGALNDDINEILSGKVPGFHPNDDAIVVFNHSTKDNRLNYREKTSPVIYHAFTDADGKMVRDTLAIFPEGTISTTKEMLNEVLSYIKTCFPARHYGMLVSSHATGWAPEMYCYNPPDKSSSGYYQSMRKEFIPLDKYISERPLTRSIGAHYNGSSSNSTEMELPEFVEAIPFHLDFLIFDCCFMGGIEVAYELKDKCDKVCFSQTEIMWKGMNYTNFLSQIFENEEPDLQSFAADYYNMYKDISGEGATISVVDCNKIDGLVPIISKYSEAINTLGKDKLRNQVQTYFLNRYSDEHGLFYDLEDILVKAGAETGDLEKLDQVLDECIICKHSTESFMTITLRTHSGLSMYLPDPDREIVNEYYKTLKWNKATGLITDNK